YDLLYNKDEHLFARDLNYVIKNNGNDRYEANGKKIFWSRGNGWVMGGLVRILKELPANYPERPFYEKLYKEMAAKIKSLQQADGLWRASLLDPDSYPGGEVSGSGFFCYALAWGINNGLLEKDAYLPAVEKAWIALNTCVNHEGRIGWVQPIGADPRKDFNADSWEVYGTGAFLLAGSEVIKIEPVQTQIAQPTPTNQQTKFLYLSGTGTDDAVMWDFYCTAGRNSGKWAQIPVPSNWEFHGFGKFTYGHDRERLNESGMYSYRFEVPNDWKTKDVHIVFDGSMTDTEVKINGKSAGAMHQGAYYRFRYDISKLLKYGRENVLEVTVHKSSSNASVEAAERYADFWVFGGIFRPVWLEALPQQHIKRVAIDAQMNGRFNMDVFLGNKVSKSEVVAQLKTIDGAPYGDPIRQNIDKTDSIRLTGLFSNPALWSSEFPNRYKVEVSLVKEGKIQHHITETVGFRTVELRPGDGFYVNNVKVKFKGVNRHVHWPTSGRAVNRNISLNDALLIKEMNM
ncbi:Beta-galactosidase, partial [termite gut metagenome]